MSALGGSTAGGGPVTIAASLRTGLGTLPLGSCATSRSSSESDESSTASAPNQPYFFVTGGAGDDVAPCLSNLVAEAEAEAGLLESMSSILGLGLDLTDDDDDPFAPTVSQPPLAFLDCSYSSRSRTVCSCSR